MIDSMLPGLASTFGNAAAYEIQTAFEAVASRKHVARRRRIAVVCAMIDEGRRNGFRQEALRSAADAALSEKTPPLAA